MNFDYERESDRHFDHEFIRDPNDELVRVWRRSGVVCGFSVTVYDFCLLLEN